MCSFIPNYVSVRCSFQLYTVFRLGKISHTRKKNHRVILPFIQGMEEAVASVATVAMVAALAGDVDKNVALT